MTDLIGAEIDRFLAEKAQETARRGRLIFALDATVSRQETWDTACQLQAEMFRERDQAGGQGRAGRAGSTRVRLLSDAAIQGRGDLKIFARPSVAERGGRFVRLKVSIGGLTLLE